MLHKNRPSNATATTTTATSVLFGRLNLLPHHAVDTRLERPVNVDSSTAAVPEIQKKIAIL